MDNENEIWKDIPDYEGYYQVSNMGRVRSVDREVRHSSGGMRILKEKVLKPVMNRDGYLKVGLWKDGKMKKFTIHRLVYSAFCGEIPNELQVNHIDEDKTNNKLENLNLMTPKQNSNWGTRNERFAKTQSKPVVALDEDGNVVFEFSSVREAGRNGFNSGNLTECCLGKRRRHRGYSWKHKENIENA